MTDTARTPAWLQIVAAAMVAARLVVFILHPITALGTVSLGVTALVAWFLLGGSRVAWVLAFLSAAGWLVAPFTLNQPVWLVGVAAVLLACLLAPASRAFVWSERQRRASGPLPSGAKQLHERVLALAYGLIVRVPGFGGRSAREIEAADRPGRGKLIMLLAICVLIFYPLVGVLSDFHHGAGRGSVIVDVLVEVVWRVYSLAQLALVVLLVMMAYRYVSGRYAGKASP